MIGKLDLVSQANSGESSEKFMFERPLADHPFPLCLALAFGKASRVRRRSPPSRPLRRFSGSLALPPEAPKALTISHSAIRCKFPSLGIHWEPALHPQGLILELATIRKYEGFPYYQDALSKKIEREEKGTASLFRSANRIKSPNV
jgi:hypothetical protein